MEFDRRQRRRLSGWLIVLLLFMQLATAAYACPRGSAAAPSPVTDLAMAGMPGCDGGHSTAMDPDRPQLCKVHCDQGSQTANPQTSLDSAPSMQLLAVLDWSPAPLQPADDARRSNLIRSGAPPPGSLPLYLALLVLRN